jgi:CheY-like chemotaxis protein
MPGFPDPHSQSILILDRRPEYARLLAALATADVAGIARSAAAQPVRDIVTFDDLDEAERWLAATPAPVVVLADVTAADGSAIDRARAWRGARGGVTLVAMFDANAEDQVQRAEAAGADAAFAKPCCRSDWSKSFGALLRSEARAVAIA